MRVELDRRDDAPATKRWEAARRRRRHGALFTRRDAIGEKHSMPQDAFVATIGQELADYGDALWRQALDYRRAQTLGGIRDFAALVVSISARKAPAGSSMGNGPATPASMRRRRVGSQHPLSAGRTIGDRRKVLGDRKTGDARCRVRQRRIR